MIIITYASYVRTFIGIDGILVSRSSVGRLRDTFAAQHTGANMTDLIRAAVLATAIATKQNLSDVKARVLQNIDAATDLADIYRAIVEELTLARIVLQRQALADFCADVFQARQDAYPGQQIANDAGYYAGT